MDVFFKLSRSDGKYICGKQRDHGQGILSAPRDADINGCLGAYQPCHPVFLHGRVPHILSCHRTGRAPRYSDTHDAVYRASAGAPQPRLRHNHIGAHNEIPRPCDARRLRNATVDVCFPDSLRYVRLCSLCARRKVAHALYVQSGNADSQPVQICISRHRRGRVEILFYRLGDDICRAAYRRHALQPC